MRGSGSWIGKKLIKSYIKRRMSDTMTEEEEEDMLKYMHQIFMRDGSTEYALFV